MIRRYSPSTKPCLKAWQAGNWENYSQVCSTEISCFEAESEGHLVEGHAFHRYYFDLASQSQSAASPVKITMARPHLRWLSDDALVVGYTRLTQTIHNGEPITTRCCEKRIWQQSEGTWLQVHVHRS